jgi:transposase, IS5 family
MYKNNAGQTTLFDNSSNFIGAKLNPENRWVKMAALIPWDMLDEKYNEQFQNKKVGNTAKAARMALGAHIIKEKFGISDEETVEHIKESPYLQWFIGLPEFTDKAPFDASTMTWFRKRLTPEMIAEVNSYIIDGGKRKRDDDNHPGSGKSDPSTDAENPAKENKGTLILDATCAPADIKFPTDVSLLNEAREKLENMITSLHQQSAQGKKPRTYKKRARRDYLRFARSKRPTIKKIRKAIKQQLGYVSRNLKTVERFLSEGLCLSEKEESQFETIRTLCLQQEEMYQERKHQIENRIVSLSQPWVRPIVRGKTNAAVEFGAKVSISMVDGYAQIERLDWNAYNEGTTLTGSVERYRNEKGCYPARILGDKIYRTRENLSYCNKNKISMNGPKLGRPPKSKAIYREQCLQEKSEAGERNAVESKFGEGKRTYGLNRIYAKRQDTSETSIYLAFLVMNLEKRLRVFLYSILKSWKSRAFPRLVTINWALISS